MIKTPDEMRELVKRELARVAGADRRAALRSLLVPPVRLNLGWDWGAPGARLDCWQVGRSPDGETLLLFCEQGFGDPWGFVGRSDDSLGMDDQWHVGLEHAAIGAGLLDAPPGYEVP
jgi:hypothetical protein